MCKVSLRKSDGDALLFMLSRLLLGLFRLQDLLVLSLSKCRCFLAMLAVDVVYEYLCKEDRIFAMGISLKQNERDSNRTSSMIVI
jgi:hypothetical protein